MGVLARRLKEQAPAGFVFYRLVKTKDGWHVVYRTE